VATNRNLGARPFLKLSKKRDTEELDVRTIAIDHQQCPAVYDSLHDGLMVKLGQLCLSPSDRQNQIAALPLLLKHDDNLVLLPDIDTPLEIDDQILFCGQRVSLSLIEWTIRDHNALRYIRTGQEGPDGIFWRKLRSHQREKEALEANK